MRWFRAISFQIIFSTVHVAWKAIAVLPLGTDLRYISLGSAISGFKRNRLEGKESARCAIDVLDGGLKCKL